MRGKRIKLTGISMAFEKDRTKNIIKNTEYLLRKNHENKLSFSQKSGLNRSTVYRLLNGEITKTQKTTVERIADFFGVNISIFESVDLESIDISENTLSFDGNKNPICVPIIPENDIFQVYQQKIGSLIINYPSTFCYSEDTNIICLSLQKNYPPMFYIGDKIFIRRLYKANHKGLFIFLSQKNELILTESFMKNENFLGIIIEER